MEETIGTPTSESTMAEAPSTMETDGSTQTPAEPWYSSLPEDLRADKNITKFQSVADLAKGYNNASALIGRDKIPMPQTDDEMRQVQFRLGLPVESKEYKVGAELGHEWILEDITESPEPGVPLDKWKSCFKDYCHGLGLTQKQTASVYERMARETAIANKKQAERVDNEMANCAAALKDQWGEAHNLNLQIASSAVSKLFGEKLTERINDIGLGRDPEFIMAMHRIGSRSLEEIGIDKQGSVARTPSDLDSEIRTLMGHPAYFKKDHPEHKIVAQKVTALMQRRYPENA